MNTLRERTKEQPDFFLCSSVDSVGSKVWAVKLPQELICIIYFETSFYNW